MFSGAFARLIYHNSATNTDKGWIGDSHLRMERINNSQMDKWSEIDGRKSQTDYLEVTGSS